MFAKEDFLRLLSFEHSLIAAHTGGLTHADTLIQPQTGGNCLNWVLGHMLHNQVALLSLLGKQSPVDPAGLEIYRGGSSPLTGAEAGILPLESLLEAHGSIHAALVEALQALSPADFQRQLQPGEDATLGWAVLYLNHHFSFHAGQLELLRQLAGRNEGPA